MTSSTTPDPAIHNVPALDSGQPILPDWAQLQAWGTTLLTEIEQWIAFALLNVSVLGVKPFVALQNFGDEALGAVTNVDTLITGIGGATMTDVVNLLLKIQQIINAIAVALGQPSGPNYTVSEIEGFLSSSVGSIPEILSNFGSSFPKTFPFQFGTSTSGTLADLVSFSQFQQLVDGIVANGSQGNPVSAAVGALQEALAAARSDVSQAIIDGVNSANVNTGIAKALQAIPPANVAAVLGGANLGADVQAIVTQATSALGGATTTLAGLVARLEAIPNANISAVLGGANLGADVQALVTEATSALGGATTTLAGLVSQLANIPLANLEGLLPQLGSSFPKTFPFTFGTSTSSTLANLVPLSKFQQLVDGIANNGISGNDVTAAIGALQIGFATARSDVAQSILDGVNSTNANTGVSQALQAFPNTNVTSVIQAGENLGSDVLSAFSGFFNLLGGSPLVGSSVQAVNAMGLTSAGEYVAALNEHITGTGSGSSGVDVLINFGSYPNSSTLPSIFTVINSAPSLATLGISGGEVVFQDNALATGGGVVRCQAIYNVTPTDTDYQVITVVFPTENTGTGAIQPEDIICGRVNTAGTTLVEAVFFGGTVQLEAVVSGVGTTSLASEPFTFIPGATYQLECGNPETETPYEYNVYCNGTPILSFIDSTPVSQVGASYRNTGFAFQADNGPGGWEGLPGTVSSFGFYDNPPAAVVGSVFRQYTASTTPTAAIASGAQLLPNSFFDTNQWISADYTSAPGNNNELQVSVSGVYSVTIVLMVDSAGAAFTPCLYHNGSVVQRAPFIPMSGLAAGNSMGFTFTVACSADDTLQPGVYSSGATNTYYGESTGTCCYWEVGFQNSGTIS